MPSAVQLASGDFDGDGYADLAVTSTYDQFNDLAIGAVNVIYGGPSGLDATGDQLFSPANLGDGVRDVGGSLETGDFDGDGYADLALSVATLNEASPSLERTAGAIVLRGSGTGLTLTDRTELWMGTPGLPDPTSIFCCMVMLAAGDADGDGADELAMGFPDLTVDAKEQVGAVAVVPGSPDGLDATQAQTFSQDTPGVPGEACGTTFGGCLNEWFGFALEFADFSGDGYDDLAVGLPRESAGALSEGAVVILLGSASGVSSAGSQIWMQGTPGVPGNGEAYDSFGNALVAADFDADGRADLAIGTELEDFAGVSSAGVVTVLRGAATGLTATGAQQWSQNSPGVPGVAEADQFGSTLAAGNFGRSARPDLAVGVPGEEAGGEVGAGIVDILYARTSGLSGSGAQSWWLDSPGIKGFAQHRSLWGSALAPR